MLNKKWVQHALAILSFFIVSMLFCKPALEGKILMASDNFQTIGSLKEADDQIKKSGVNVAGWTGYMFSGMPVFRGNHSNKLIKMVYGFKQAPHAHSYDLLIWLMISFYFLCLALDVPIIISAGVSIAFAFCGFNIMSMEGGHFQKIFALAMVPGTMAGIIDLLKGRMLRGSILTILFLNLLTGVNHTQITYYALIACSITGLFFLFANWKNLTTQRFIAIAGVFAVALTLTVLSNISVFHIKVTSEATTRGGQSELTVNKKNKGGLDPDYAASWSMDRIEFFSYFIPDFAGGPSGNYLVQDRESHTFKAFRSNNPRNANEVAQLTSAYWGNQPFVGGGFYMGASMFFLFLLFLFINRDYRTAWLGLLFAITVLVAMGNNLKPLFNFLFEHLPLYNKFRVPSMINLIVQIIVAIGAALAIDQIVRKEVDKRRVFIAMGGIAAFYALVVLLAPMFFDFYSRGANADAIPQWLNEALRKDRVALMQKDGLRALFIIAMIGGLIWAYLSDKLKQPAIVLGVLAVIVCADTMTNAARHLDAEKYVSKRKAMSIFNPTQADLQILQDQDPHFRVLNLTRSPFNDAITSYHHKSIGGYHGAKLRRYQELIEMQISKNNRAVFNMLNLKYFITRDNNNNIVAQRNGGALGPVWYVDSLSVVANADEEMAGLNAPFQPAQYAILRDTDVDGTMPLSYNNSGNSIQLVSYSPDKMVYRANNSTRGFAVFSEIYYLLKNGAGWHAYINGEEVDIKKVNFTLRGLSVPAGQSDIEFIFNKDKVSQLNRIRTVFSYITAVVILLLIGFSILKLYRKD